MWSLQEKITEMKQLTLACAYTVIFLLLNGCSRTPNVPNNPARFIEKEKGPIDIPKGQSYRFGYLEVPENRQHPNSNRIQLPVYIFKSRNPNPKPDPIIYTVGGPGYSSMRSARYMQYYQYLDDRDFILFEQRGNQYAKPHLACPEWSQAVYTANLPSTTPMVGDSLKEQAARACSERLRRQGIDLNGYHTRESAADIADLRKVLKLDQYNLLTISYSTKIAQVLLRDYPQGIRSVIMESPLPLEVNYDEESNQNLVEVLDKLLKACEASPSCQGAFPGLKKRFYQYLEDITNNPQKVLVEHPKSGEMETFLITGKDIVGLLSSLSADDVPTIPIIMERFLAGDLAALKPQLASLLEGPSKGAGVGMRLSVWCAEEYPFNSQDKIQEETKRYAIISGLSPTVYSASVCEAWSVKVQGPLENKAVKSDIPVLLMNGEYDNLTPPKWASKMLPNLSNSYHLVFPGWRHNVATYWSNPCGMESANAFFNDPYSKPNLECFSQIQAPEFQLE